MADKKAANFRQNSTEDEDRFGYVKCHFINEKIAKGPVEDEYVEADPYETPTEVGSNPSNVRKAIKTSIQEESYEIGRVKELPEYEEVDLKGNAKKSSEITRGFSRKPMKKSTTRGQKTLTFSMPTKEKKPTSVFYTLVEEPESGASENDSKGQPVPSTPPPPPITTLQRKTGELARFPSFTQYGCDPDDIKQIIISGLDKRISFQTAKSLFEDEKLGVHSTLTSVEYVGDTSDTVVSFEDRRDVQRLLAKGNGLSIGGQPLKMAIYNPPAVYKDKFFVYDIPDTMKQYQLTAFIKRATGHDVSSMLYGEESGSCVVSLAKREDINTVTRTIQETLDSVTVRCSVLEITDCIKVEGWSSRSSTFAQVRSYFSNRNLSDGGPVTDLVFHPKYDALILTFESWQDAFNTLMKKSHVISKTEVKVSPYFKCLDVTPSSIANIPEPVTDVVLNQYLISYVSGSPSYKSLLKSALEKVHGSLEWQMNLQRSVKIICNVKPTEENARTKVKEWEEKCIDLFHEIVKNIVVEDKFHTSSNQKIFSEVVLKVNTLLTMEQEVALFLDEQQYRLVVVGHRDTVAKFTKPVSSIIDEIEKSDVCGDTVKIKNVKAHELSLLSCFKFQQEVEKMAVTLNEEKMDRGITRLLLKGKKQSVDKALSLLYKNIESCSEKKIEGLKEEECELLRSDKIMKYIQEHLENKNKVGSYTVDQQSTLIIISSRKDLTSTEKAFKNCISFDLLPLKRDLDEGDKQVISSIQDGLEGLAVINTNIPGEIRVASANFCIEEICSNILLYLDSSSHVAESVDVDAGRFKFIQTLRKLEIDKIIKKFMSSNVEINCKSSECRIKLTGLKHHVRDAIVEINRLLYDVVHTVLSMTLTDFRHLLEADTGMDELRNIEMDEKCILMLDINSVNANVLEIPPREMAHFRVGEVSVYVMSGDLTCLDCDAIVCHSRESLQPVGGLGNTIVSKGGFTIQSECNEHVEKNGSLSAGQVFLSKAGNLKCRNIFHMVSLVEDGKDEWEQRHQRKAILNALETASENNMVKIGMPLPRMKSNRGAIDALMEIIYNFSQGERTQGVTKICICDMNTEIPPQIIQELNKNEHFTKVDETFFDDEVFHRRGSSLKEENVEQENFIRTPYLFEQLNVEVVVGELATQKVDVIVNSTNPNMSLSVGSVSRSLLAAGGDIIQDECNTKYPNGLKVGDIGVTTGGQLSCKHLFHGRLDHWDSGQGHAEKVLSILVERCLARADEMQIRTIAFPALGTGGLGFPPEVSARVMFDTIDRFEHTISKRSTSLEKILIMVWDGDPQSTKIFQETKAKKRRPVLQNKRRTLSLNLKDLNLNLKHYEEIFTTSGKFHVISVDQLNVEITHGDVTKERTDVIVNSIGADLTYGNVSKAILKAAGPSIKVEFTRKGYKEKLEKEGMIVTNGGYLFCQKIIHIRARSSQKGLEEAVIKALSTAEELGMRSMSFPAIGTGAKGLSPAMVTHAMSSAIRQYAGSRSYLRCLSYVNIVVYRLPMMQEFVKGFREAENQQSRSSIWQKPRKEESNDVIFHIYTDTMDHAKHTKATLTKLPGKMKKARKKEAAD